MSTHVQNLTRVRHSIAAVIVAFLRGVGVGGRFHAEELRDHVRRECPTAPASADRVLRDLRQRGRIDYTLVSRSGSLYEVRAIGRPEQGALFGGSHD